MTDTQLSSDTILTITKDEDKHGHSFTATDIKTSQVMTIDNEGYVEHYTLNKVA